MNIDVHWNSYSLRVWGNTVALNNTALQEQKERAEMSRFLPSFQSSRQVSSELGLKVTGERDKWGARTGPKGCGPIQESEHRADQSHAGELWGPCWGPGWGWGLSLYSGLVCTSVSLHLTILYEHRSNRGQPVRLVQGWFLPESGQLKD